VALHQELFFYIFCVNQTRIITVELSITIKNVANAGKISPCPAKDSLEQLGYLIYKILQ